MTSRGRIDDFQGSNSEYIVFLESRVHQLTAAILEHQNSQLMCFSGPAVHEDRDTNPRSGGIQFVENVISTSRVKRQRTQPPRWQREMDEMLRDIPSVSSDWCSKRESVGLLSSTDFAAAFDIIIDGVEPSTKPPAANTDRSLIRYEPSNTILQLVTNYAQITAVLEVKKKFTEQVLRFRMLIFVSLCCVLIFHGVEKSLVNQAMRICISEADDKYLDCLRRGASWVNRVIDALALKGLDDRASELFLLCGQSLSQYGRFADAGQAAFLYFTKKITTRKLQASEAEMHGRVSFFIPLFIKEIVDGIYSLQDICTALGYHKELFEEEHLRYHKVHQSREIELADSVGGNCTDIPTSDHTSVQIQTLLNAAQQSDCSDQTVHQDPISLASNQVQRAKTSVDNNRDISGTDVDSGIERTSNSPRSIETLQWHNTAGTPSCIHSLLEGTFLFLSADSSQYFYRNTNVVQKGLTFLKRYKNQKTLTRIMNRHIPWNGLMEDGMKAYQIHF